MATETKKLISFGQAYQKEFDYLQKQKNASQYVGELIRKDMMGKQEVTDKCDCSKIKEVVREVLDEYDFGIVANRKNDEIADYSNKIDELFNV